MDDMATTLIVKYGMDDSNPCHFMTMDIIDTFHVYVMDENGCLFRRELDFDDVETLVPLEYNGFLRYTNGRRHLCALYHKGIFKGVREGGISSWIKRGCSPEHLIRWLSLVCNDDGLNVKEIKECLSMCNVS